jgi:hypothetical protein
MRSVSPKKAPQRFENIRFAHFAPGNSMASAAQDPEHLVEARAPPKQPYAAARTRHCE